MVEYCHKVEDLHRVGNHHREEEDHILGILDILDILPIQIHQCLH
jgi:hypothetical protein